MTKEERHHRILDLLYKDTSVPVTDLVDSLNVSAVTIRKDLAELEASGRLYRSHGRANIINHSFPFKQISQREKTLFRAEKEAIAREAASLIEPDDCVTLSAGTTVRALANALEPTGRLTVITPSLHVAAIMGNYPATTVYQLGGVLQHDNLSIVGRTAEEALKWFAPGKLFLGVSGIDLGFGCSAHEFREAMLNQAMIKAAQKTIVLADSSKFGRRGFSRIAAVSDIDMIITDNGVSPAMVREIESLGVEVRIARP